MQLISEFLKLTLNHLIPMQAIVDNSICGCCAHNSYSTKDVCYGYLKAAKRTIPSDSRYVQWMKILFLTH